MKKAAKSEKKRRGKIIPAVGVGLMTLTSTACASMRSADANTEVRSTNVPMAEEEVSDVSLATFHVFDREGPVRLAAGHGGGGGCGQAVAAAAVTAAAVMPVVVATAAVVMVVVAVVVVPAVAVAAVAVAAVVAVSYGLAQFASDKELLTGGDMAKNGNCTEVPSAGWLGRRRPSNSRVASFPRLPSR